MDKLKKTPLLQLIFLAILSVLLFINFLSDNVRHINSTSFALSYDYGFISRGLMGSLFNAFCSLFHDMYNPNGLLLFVYILAVLLFVLVLGLITYCYKKLPSDKTIYLTYTSYFLIVFLVTTYVSNWNLGRLDTYCLLFTIVACYTIVSGKCVWICIPCSILATLTHQGYVFMYANIILALLLFCAIQNRDGKRNYYLSILVLTLISISSIFIYTEFFSHSGKDIYYETVVNSAGHLNIYGQYHDGVIRKELMGISLYDEEKRYMLIACLTMLVFLVMVSPYIIISVKFLINLLKSGINKAVTLSYIVLAIGPLTLLPEYIMKCDYGRWTLCLIVYYSIVLLIASTIDNKVVDCIRDYLIPKKRLTLIASMAYALLFIPFRDVLVCYIPGYIANLIFHFV